MQDRYLGDIHDFYKFLFIKKLSTNFKTKIGLNWYLIDPKDLEATHVVLKKSKNLGATIGFLKKSFMI